MELVLVFREPLPVPLDDMHRDKRLAVRRQLGRQELDPQRRVQVAHFHLELDLGDVVGRDSAGHDLPLHRTLDLHAPARGRDAVRTGAEPGVVGVHDEAHVEDRVPHQLSRHVSGSVL